MRKSFSLDTKNKRGITLVSLVVTIIVLLILAGITINLIIGEDGIIRRAQEAGKNYIAAAENEKVQLGQFTNEMDNIIGGSTNSGREPYNSEFRKNVVEAIKNAGVATTEEDTDETIVANIGKILQEKIITEPFQNASIVHAVGVNGLYDSANTSYTYEATKDCNVLCQYSRITAESTNGNGYIETNGVELVRVSDNDTNRTGIVTNIGIYHLKAGQYITVYAYTPAYLYAGASIVVLN